MTLKDIIKFLSADKTDRDLGEISISEVMTKHLIRAKKNTRITECAKLLATNNVSSLIIVDDDNKNNNSNLVGIITSTDFVNFFSENCIGITMVKDHMSQSLFTVSIKDKVSKAAQIMSEKKISRLVVIDPDNQNKLVGIISEVDLLRSVPTFRSRTIRSVYGNMEFFFNSKPRSDFIEPSFVRMEDIMTVNPTTIEKDADLAEAAKIMIKQGISGLPVVELRDKIEQTIGIISKSDIVKALTKAPKEDVNAM